MQITREKREQMLLNVIKSVTQIQHSLTLFHKVTITSYSSWKCIFDIRLKHLSSDLFYIVKLGNTRIKLVQIKYFIQLYLYRFVSEWTRCLHCSLSLSLSLSPHPSLPSFLHLPPSHPSSALPSFSLPFISLTCDSWVSDQNALK